MKNIINIIVLFITSSFLVNIHAQTNLKLQSGTIIKVTSDIDIVLKNTNFINNGIFNASNGTVHITGNGAATQSQIGGSSKTTFYNLTINKENNNAALGQNTTINNQLTFSSGKFIIGNYNLTMGNTATFSGQNKDRYIVTDGTGNLIRQVGNTWVAFPIGNSTFNPARLKNVGTLDNFSVRVRDNFLQNGTSGNAINSDVIPRTWLIEEETVGGSDVSMRLIWRPLHHNNNGFNTNNAAITHFTGGTWQDKNTGASVVDNSYNSDHRYREATNITSFSPFGVRNSNNMPVELLYFYGERENNNVQLSWQTATEINNSHFEVEWSKDGFNFAPNSSSVSWQKIGEVQGAGTTMEPQFYGFLDDLNRIGFKDRHGSHYYRLKQIDLDGQFEYTNIIQVTIEPLNNLTINIYPNPATDYIIIDGIKKGETIQIFNVYGQEVMTFHQNISTQRTNISNLPSGSYFVKIGKGVKKLVIQ